jgi:hypothetical protein
VPVRFSLDETFDVGEHAGTPVVEDYVDKMSYRFTGKLKKFGAILEPEKLSEDKRKHLCDQDSKGFMALQ